MAGGIDWFRWHHGSVTDPKFSLVAAKAKARIGDVITVWAYLLETASASSDRGCFGKIDFEAVDHLLGSEDGTTARIVEEMARRGLIDGGEICSWTKRQPRREREDDKSTERVRAFRERKQQEEDETQCNATKRHETPREEKSREEVNPPSLRSGQGSPAGTDCPTGFDADAEEIDDPDKAIHSLVWSEGVPLLTAKGVKEKAARGLLGKLCKAVGDLEALAVIEAMRAADPGEPASWLSAAIKRREAENAGTSFAEFVAGCKERGEPVVSEYQPLRDYIAEAGLPMPFIEVAWGEFKRRHMLGGTWAQARREDCRRSFLITVELNAIRLWRIDRGSGEYLLTDIGLQAQKAHANRSAA